MGLDQVTGGLGRFFFRGTGTGRNFREPLARIGNHPSAGGYCESIHLAGLFALALFFQDLSETIGYGSGLAQEPG